ncbi:MAG TPA: hypothetical protein VI636_15600 [Candidatus Angelobacter sp.]
MPDSRMSYADNAVAKSAATIEERSQRDVSKSGYFAVSPNGAQVPITRELFVAFSDFMKTRKYPGSIAIQFRGGEIICVEALTRKTYRNT